MPFSHHSHSGEFCNHANNTLEEMIQTAISRRMRVFAMTEHMPRDHPEDLYPEEIATQKTTYDLVKAFDDYYNHACRLRSAYQSQIHLLLGFEAEYIRPDSIKMIRSFQQLYKFDFFVGSIHHVNTIPIDFDKQRYWHARASVGGTETQIFEAYFDAQYEMLRQLQPAVVGHFDLIRLMSDEPTKPLWDYGSSVWLRVVRNIDLIATYGGLMELNSASLRKGWTTPYPQRDVCDLFISKGGRFTLSDDSHSVDQVGLNYHHILGYIHQLGLQYIYYLEKLPPGEVAVDILDACAVRQLTINDLQQELFWYNS